MGAAAPLGTGVMGRWLMVLTCVAVAAVLPAWPATHVVVLRGLGGTPELEQRFAAWSGRLAGGLEAVCGIPAEQIHIYPPLDGTAQSLTREKAADAFASASADIQKEDAFLLFLIGHGSLQQEAKFMVDGPDISAGDFGDWLAQVPASRQVIVNTTSASVAFINALSAPGRIVCTSTRSGTERNATEFMEHFLLVLEEGRGDANRDGKLSLGEWFDAAAADTLAWYEREGYIATEHALLEDNGDGRGSRLPLEASDAPSRDGALAAEMVMRQDARLAGVDPEQLARYGRAIERVKALTAAKDSLDRDLYWEKLEGLLLEAAQLNPALASGPMDASE